MIDIVELFTDIVSNDYNVEIYKQNEVYEMITSRGYEDEFPMISFERSSDSQFEVTPDESKFLNDPIHRGKWIVGYDSSDLPVFILNLKHSNDNLDIDTLEVAASRRGEGIGKYVVKSIQSSIDESGEFNGLSIQAFDSEAHSFWSKIGYMVD